MDGSAGCDSYFEDVLTDEDGEIRVYRCDWGWYVKSPHDRRAPGISMRLEEVLGRLDQAALRALVDTLGRQLTAERDRAGRTASRSLGRQATTA